MNKILSLSFFFLLVISCAGQNNSPWVEPKPDDYPEVKKVGKSVSDFVPKGFKIVSTVTGDLNGDKVPDAAVHIIGTFEKFLNKNDWLGEPIFDSNPRILFILFRNTSTGFYRIAKQTNKFIIPPCGPVCSEPLRGMSIARGVLRLDFELWQSAGSWGVANGSYKFKYLNGKFALIGIDREDHMRNSAETEKRSYNFLTRRLKIAIGRTDGTISKIIWKNLKREPLKNFSTFPKPFEWEIESDFLL